MALKRKPRPRRFENPEDVRMTLGEHLEELRSRLIKAIAGLVVGAILAYIFIEQIVGLLLWPVFAILQKHGFKPEMKSFNPAEIFITDLKVAVIIGFILSAPYSLSQLWGFVASGLYPYERKWVERFAPISIGLFFTGAGFLLLVVSPLLLDFLIGYRKTLPDYGQNMPSWLIPGARKAPLKLSDPSLLWLPVPSTQKQDEPPEADLPWPTSQPIVATQKDPSEPPELVPWINLTERTIRIRVGNETYNMSHLEPVRQGNRIVPEMRVAESIPFILHLAAAFGIGFQVPVVVAFLALTGIFDTRQMAMGRRYIWFGMAITCAFLTPPDLASMMFLLLPMSLLFEVGLLAGRMIERKRSTNE